MIKKKKIPIKSLVLILILVELICLVFAGILGEPGNDINLKTASWMWSWMWSDRMGIFSCVLFGYASQHTFRH